MKTYALLGIVAIIWGIIGFKILKVLSPDPIQEPEFARTSFKTTRAIKHDTFSVRANYRDPFLGTIPIKKEQRQRKVVSQKQRAPDLDIVFTGVIQNNKTKDHIFFVIINGQQYLFTKGKKNVGVTLVKGSSTDITIRYNGRHQKIAIQK